MQLSKEQIKDIVGSLDCGMTCYVHRETKEVITIPDLNDAFADPEPWEEEIEKVDKNIDKYLKIEKRSSRDDFEIMEAFVEEVSNKRIQDRLISALNGRKPFKNFKNTVDHNENVRQHWFKFKAYKYGEWVKDCLEADEEDTDELEEEIPFIGGYFNDDGTPFNPSLHPLPNLCLSCKKRNDPSEEMLCNLTRMDQVDDIEFKCFAYENMNK